MLKARFCRWAWHNTHLTKKIPDEDRITFASTRCRISKSGHVRRRPARPRASLTDKISNLHLLLRVPSFARWPLQLRFLAEDVHRVWRTWCDRADAEIRGDLSVTLDISSDTSDLVETEMPEMINRMGFRSRYTGGAGVANLDVSFNSLKGQVEKSLELAQIPEHTCAVCSRRLPSSVSTALTCPAVGCNAISHLTCLAKYFRTGTGSESLIPLSGDCPLCRAKLQWIDLVKELSLRKRGMKDLETLMTKPKARKRKIVITKQDTQPHSSVLCSIESSGRAQPPDDDELVQIDMLDNDQLPDDWLEQVDEDSMSVYSTESELSDSQSFDAARSSAMPPTIVIEDSDWDNAEVLD